MFKKTLIVVSIICIYNSCNSISAVNIDSTINNMTIQIVNNIPRGKTIIIRIMKAILCEIQYITMIKITINF